MKQKKGKICIVVSTIQTVNAFLLNHLFALSKDYDVTLIATTDDSEYLYRIGLDARLIPVRIERGIAPLHDLRAFINLVWLFRKHKFDIIHSVTSKVGLLAISAGFLARTTVRIHYFTGQAWATKKGLFKWALKQADLLIALMATHALVDSFSQKSFLVSQGIMSERKAKVLANGSICGVDLKRFSPDKKMREQMRKKLGIAADAFVLLFMARLTRDKGILDLATAFRRLCELRGDVHLLIVGPDEENIASTVLSLCHPYENSVRLIPLFVSEHENYLQAADVVCLPSYREGFGNVIIDAAAMGIPAIGSNIYGIQDAIEDEVTGLLHEVGNIEDILKCLRLITDQPELRREMGERAKTRAGLLFSCNIVTDALLDYYKEIG